MRRIDWFWVTALLLFAAGLRIVGLSYGQPRSERFPSYAPFPLYVFSRVYSVFGGLLMVACAYAVSRLVCGRNAAIFAGLIVASSYTLVTHAHYAKPNSLATGWMMLAMWSGVCALFARRLRSRERFYILAGIATGLAASTYYNGVAVAIIIAPIGFVLNFRHRGWRTVAVIGDSRGIVASAKGED
jgi:dolichyl-phosphate-mannose--protein O-mannosyl transferase